ncbi:MAG: S4 domain-containing protein [Pseudomonadota bacterium]
MSMADRDTLRLDLLLWYLRFARSRSLAKTMVQSGKLRCNGRRVVKAHHQVGIGDVLTLMHRGRVIVIRVDILPGRRGSGSQAAGHYHHLSGRDGLSVATDRENVSAEISSAVDVSVK